jgi:hypothetical protein
VTNSKHAFLTFREWKINGSEQSQAKKRAREREREQTWEEVDDKKDCGKETAERLCPIVKGEIMGFETVHKVMLAKRPQRTREVTWQR